MAVHSFIESPLQDPANFDCSKKGAGFSEVTGGMALSFRDLLMGETAGLGFKI
jgi:hypothetical protein